MFVYFNTLFIQIKEIILNKYTIFTLENFHLLNRHFLDLNFIYLNCMENGCVGI